MRVWSWPPDRTRQPFPPLRCADFIFLNSSARGPFLPAALQDRVRWTTLFTGLLTAQTKLVGPTISCGGYCYKAPGQPRQKCLKSPHVQSVAVATDQVGVGVEGGG